MSDKELLRITMSEAQVKEACMEFAESRASIAEPCTIEVRINVASDGAHLGGAEVIFTRKRARATKAAARVAEAQDDRR